MRGFSAQITQKSGGRRPILVPKQEARWIVCRIPSSKIARGRTGINGRRTILRFRRHELRENRLTRIWIYRVSTRAACARVHGCTGTELTQPHAPRPPSRVSFAIGISGCPCDGSLATN